MAGRRGNNEGLIRKRTDGRWEARLTLEGGKHKYFYGKTRQEVVRALNGAIRDKDQGIPPVEERQTLEKFLQSWLETVKHTIKPSTWQRYEDYVRLHTIPVLGKYQLTKLLPQQIQALYNQKLKEGLSPTTVHHLHAMLHRALNSAMRLGLLQRNITDMVEAPRMAVYKYVTLTAEQARSFLASASGERLEALYVLAIATGMREGELLALRWADIDFEYATLHVRSTLHYLHGEFSFSEPKTAFSRRQIALPQIVIQALKRHRHLLDEEKAVLGEAWDTTHDLVFPNTVGKPINPSNLVLRDFRPLLEKANLPLIRFHDLRHTAATLLLKAGIHPKVVSEMLGHSHISITLSVYSHVTPDMQRTAAVAMDLVLGDIIP